MSVVVVQARDVHAALWRMSGDPSAGTKLAHAVTKAWQKRLLGIDATRFRPEFPVGGEYGERIDVVDVVDATAYELKVSPNNAHFEFYRDVFKVALARHAGTRIDRFVFLAPRAAIVKLRSTMARSVEGTSPFGFTVEMAALEDPVLGGTGQRE